MSKFTDLITARPTGTRHPQRPELAGFSAEISISPSHSHSPSPVPSRFPCDKEYVVSLNFNRFLRVSDCIPERVAVEEAERGFKKELEYLVYSDLAPLIHNLREHVYNSSNVELREAFKALQDEVLGR